MQSGVRGLSMYLILTYDISSPKRLPKVLKTCRKFLHWVQNSVFEGELTQNQMDELLKQLMRIIDKNSDSVVVYAARMPEIVQKRAFGIIKNSISNYF